MMDTGALDVDGKLFPRKSSVLLVAAASNTVSSKNTSTTDLFL
jgi:hypothetical protein